ncbi:MAG: DNA-directed RNA polymerase subunit A' [Candidatus Aenigmarchaeota archaeon]|nr:DNA-directed RNA polymerase subunit A' [Candidatus Aenigmarchaeota archaeon]
MADMKEVQSVEFGVISPKMILKMATVRIARAELYDPDGYPIDGGVMDPRMGVIDPGLRCRTCGGSVGDCGGHFGYLELARPIVHVLYSKFIYRLLKAVCRKCGKLLTDSREKTTLKDLIKSANKKCTACGEEQGEIKFEKPYSFWEDKSPLNSMSIRERFEKIPDEDLELVKVRIRPEWLIITILPVPPVTVRPSITLETGERSEDDLTHKLVDIVRINQRLKENIDIGAPDFIIEDLWELLQYHVSTFFDNELTGVPHARHRSGRGLKTLVQRLKTKEGRFRSNLAGKRVNFCARTVISPDNNIDIDEVGVPEIVAKELTVPVRVTEFNIAMIKEVVKNGPNVWPGANYATRTDGRKKKITEESKIEISEEITLGWIVERHLQNGDIVLFNRQPSLHRMSIMAHRVRVMPYRTFRLNLCVSPPYNADFDGDEMNLHVPQTEEAQAEAMLLMEVQNQIRSPRFGGPIIAPKNDHISGLFLLTKKDSIFTKEEAAQVLAYAGIDAQLPDKEKITGKEIFSLLLPQNLNIEFQSTWHKGKSEKEEDSNVVIRDGKLVKGVIDKSAVGSEEGAIIDKLEKMGPPHEVSDFINKVSRLGTAMLDIRGFTVGISDNDLSEDAKKLVARAIKKAEEDVTELIGQYDKGKLESLPDRSLSASLEVYIMQRLAKAVNECGEIVSLHVPENDTIYMARTGARGSLVNVTQTAACIGQETVLGQRIHRGYLNRTLPHFKKGDLSPISHGFVGTSFKAGLTPFEFFWDSLNGREGLMDKSLRTRHSGYMERRLVNALQDLKVKYDMTVRDLTNSIVQFLPGEDGIDPAKSNWGKFDVDNFVTMEVSKDD